MSPLRIATTLTLALLIPAASASTSTSASTDDLEQVASCTEALLGKPVLDRASIPLWIRLLSDRGLRVNSYSFYKTGSPTAKALAELSGRLYGRPLSAGTLLTKAIAEFGSWPEALRAAGLDPDKIRRVNIPWSRDLIVACIQALKKAGVSISPGKIANDKSAATSKILQKALRTKLPTNGHAFYYVVQRGKFFKSWDEALVAAGFDPEAERIRDPMDWSGTDTAEVLRELHEQGLPVNAGAVARDLGDGPISRYLSKRFGRDVSGKSLAEAVFHQYASWDDVLRAAGLDPKDIRKDGVHWTRELVLQAIQRLHQIGEPLNRHAMHEPTSERVQKILGEITGKPVSKSAVMGAWIYNQWGSWDEALHAAGLNVLEIKMRASRIHLNKTQVIEIIKYLDSKGVPMASWRKMSRQTRLVTRLTFEKFGLFVSSYNVYFSAYIHFESYRDALKAAKVKIPRRISRAPVDRSAIPDWQEQREWEEQPGGALTVNRTIGPRIVNPEEEFMEKQELEVLQSSIQSQDAGTQQILSAVLEYLEEHDDLGDLKALSGILSRQIGRDIRPEDLLRALEVLREDLG